MATLITATPANSSKTRKISPIMRSPRNNITRQKISSSLGNIIKPTSTLQQIGNLNSSQQRTINIVSNLKKNNMKMTVNKPVSNEEIIITSTGNKMIFDVLESADCPAFTFTTDYSNSYSALDLFLNPVEVTNAIKNKEIENAVKYSKYYGNYNIDDDNF